MLHDHGANSLNYEAKLVKELNYSTSTCLDPYPLSVFTGICGCQHRYRSLLQLGERSIERNARNLLSCTSEYATIR
jgi:hypothetical protein